MLTWNADAAVNCTASGGWSGSLPTSGSQSTGPLTSNTSYNIACDGPGGSTSESILVAVVEAVPTAGLTVEPSTVSPGGSATLTWSSTNTNFCTATGGWTGTLGTSGTQTVGPLTNTTDYDLICIGPAGSALQTATVTVVNAAPGISLSAQPSTVTPGGSTTLSWNAVNASTCTASGAWSGVLSTSGSHSTGAITATSTYSLTCSGPGGTATQSVIVSVSTASAPTISLSASPSSVSSGGGATVNWTSTNAVSCAASGGWSGFQGASGSFTTGALTATTTYTLSCTNATGTVTQSTTVTVSAAAPTVQLTANPSTVSSGNTSTLIWSSTNATVCTASGGWSGSLPTSGTQVTTALSSNTKFTLACTGAGGSASQSVTVTVTANTPTVSISASPNSVASGQTSTLTWSSTGATACTASGGWSGVEPTSGTQVTAAISAATTYTLTCTGAGGSGSRSVTVALSSAPPTVSISANPSTVPSGGSTTLIWSSSNATSCTASGGWNGTLAASGSQLTAALTANTTYTLTCTGADGTSAPKSVTVSIAASGSLGITTPSTLPNATSGGSFFYLLAASGGTPPYSWTLVSSTGSTAWVVTPGGWVEAAPTTEETDSVVVEVTDSAKNAVQETFAVTVNSTLAVMNQAPPGGISLPPAVAGNAFSHTLGAAGGTAPYTWSIASGSLPAGLSLSSSGVITGTPSASGNVSGILLRVTDNVSNTATATAAISVGAANKVSRPSYNTGGGFFVYNGQLYDPNGNVFHIRGVNRNHYDSDSAAGMGKSGANAVRWFMYNEGVVGFPPPSTYVTEALEQNIDYKEFPIIVAANTAGEQTGISGDQSVADLVTTATWWANNESAFAPIMNRMAINIANEWGPANSANWATAYETAIPLIRAAGYTCPLVIDTGGSGEDVEDLLNYATAVFNSDPQKNIIFSIHLYYVSSDALANNWLPQLASLAATQGMVFVVGEFGPGHDIGPAPTLVTPQQIIQAAESAGLGWLAWAWDDNNLPDSGADNTWFSMTYHAGVYTKPGDLTYFGLDVTLNPSYGWDALASPASAFLQ